jgi:hypothetical protein
MLKKWLGGIVLVALVLASAAPACAQGRTEPAVSARLLGRAWQWLASFWETGGRRTEPAGKPGKAPVKQGGYIDPNGLLPPLVDPPSILCGGGG